MSKTKSPQSLMTGVSVYPTRTLAITAVEIAAAVPVHEYQRLLSLPRDYVLEGDLLERAQNARTWYEQHGNPFIASRRIGLGNISADSVSLDLVRASRSQRSRGVQANAAEETSGPQEYLNDKAFQLNSAVLAKRLRDGEAHAIEILAATAGTAVAQEVTRLWSVERPDEAFFLDRFAVAVTERLLFWSSATLCRASEAANETLMLHLSPGCGHWDLADQHKLMTLLTGTENQESGGRILGPLQLVPSGALHPQHSVLAVMGVTHRKFVFARELLCRSCDLDPCTFRRAPFGGEALRPLEAQ
jgi:hypothetical protein